MKQNFQSSSISPIRVNVWTRLPLKFFYWKSQFLFKKDRNEVSKSAQIKNVNMNLNISHQSVPRLNYRSSDIHIHFYNSLLSPYVNNWINNTSLKGTRSL